MSKIYKKIVHPISVGLLFFFPFVILPFMIGCGKSTENPAQTEPESATTASEQVVPEQPKTVSEEFISIDAVPAEQVTEDSPIVEPVAPEPVVPEPVEVEPIFLKSAANEESDSEKPVANEPVDEGSVHSSLPDETPVVEQKSPVNEVSPVDETSPVDESSPVDETSTIQGNLTLFFARLLPSAVLVLQDEEAETSMTETNVKEVLPASEQNSVPVPSMSADSAPVDSAAVEEENVSLELGQNDVPQREDGQRNLQQGNFQQRGNSQRGGNFQRGRRGTQREGEQIGTMPQTGQDMGGGQQNFGGRGGSGIPASSAVRGRRLIPAETLQFNFQNSAWRDVIEWFANQAALNLQADKMPTGSVNLADIKPYTPTEALDVINGYLLLKDYVLVRKVNTLFVLYLPDGIPPNLLDPILPEDLDQKGKYEICKCVFSLNRTTPDIIQTEVEMFLGPQGSILLMPRSQQVVITETAGVLRAVREIIQRIDDPDGVTTGSIHVVEIKNLTAQEATEMMRKLLTIEETDTTLRTVVDSTGKKVLLSGRGDMIEKAKGVLQTIDASFGSSDPEMSGQPTFRTYPTGSADPATVYAVLQTLLVGMPETRLSRDPKSGGIVVLGRPAVHAKVSEAIESMEFNAQQVVSIPLNRMSPLKAVETIKLFYPTYSPATATQTTGDGRGRGNQRNAVVEPAIQPPSVEADTMARQIIVRGTRVQIAEIRDLLKQLGEDGTTAVANVSTIRPVPLSPAAAALVLEQLKDVLPSFDSSIKVNMPELDQENPPSDEKNDGGKFRMERMNPNSEEYQYVPDIDEPMIDDIDDLDIDNLIDETFDTDLPITQRMMKEANNPILAQVAPAATAQSEVNIMVTPAGLVLSSTDPEALAKLEGVIRMLSDESVLQRTSLEIYYLTHSTASVVNSSLQSLLGTSTSTDPSGVSSVDMPDWDQAAMMGSLALPQANAVEKTGDVAINVDERLNALYVQANVIDHKTIKKLIDMLDQPGRDNIMKNASPRLLPLVNMRPEDAKTLVETAFSSRMQGSRAGQQGGMQQMGRAAQQRGNQRGGQMPPGMQQMLQAMGQGRGNANAAREQDPGMTVAVYPQGRALIVTSSESLYREVKAFVEIIDADTAKSVTTTATEKLVHTTPALVGQSLMNMLGSNVVTISTNRTTQGQMTGGNYGGMGNIGMLGNNRGGAIGGGMFGGAMGNRGGAMGGGTLGGNRGGAMGAGTIGGNRGGAMGAGTIGGNRGRR